ncbi:terpene synthase family protein [Candidatus Burkholderia verschuerenii]|uniref:terpene synthase family protein n=1 Tax=Candidatus Burkholderia verschuerenii TaxID=242163 RepID=UPI0009F9E56D
MLYTPTLQEYLDNAWISIAAPVQLVHAYFATLSDHPIATEALESLDKYRDIIRYSAMILRLGDDLGTSSVCKKIEQF